MYIIYQKTGGQQSNLILFETDMNPTACCTRARIRDIPNSAVICLTYLIRDTPDLGPRATGRSPRVLDKCVAT